VEAGRAVLVAERLNRTHLKFSLDEICTRGTSPLVHILLLNERVDLGGSDGVGPGEFIVDDLMGAQLLSRAGGGQMKPVDHASGTCADMVGQTTNVLFMRAGGFGDLVLLTPVLREFKRLNPQTTVAVATMPGYGQVLAGLPYVDEVITYPVATEKLYQYEHWVFFENAIERNAKAREVHMTDLFAEIAGVPFTDATDRKAEYRVSASEAVWANVAYPRINGTRRVAIQVGASALCRVYPRPLLGQVVATLLKDGFEVMLLGAKGEITLPGQNPPNLKNLSEHDLTFRQSCAVVNGADVFLGGDSALLHVAGALGVPAVGLYAPFPWQLRTRYAPTTHALTGNLSCSPCFHHPNPARRNWFPDHCPTKTKGYCGALAEIKPERIVSLVQKVARNLGDVVLP